MLGHGLTRCLQSLDKGPRSDEESMSSSLVIRCESVSLLDNSIDDSRNCLEIIRLNGNGEVYGACHRCW